LVSLTIIGAGFALISEKDIYYEKQIIDSGHLTGSHHNI
jgi:hypothetical protein